MSALPYKLNRSLPYQSGLFGTLFLLPSPQTAPDFHFSIA